jgi:hypothetical protein
LGTRAIVGFEVRDAREAVRRPPLAASSATI